jgi:flagellar basal body rod protein FlgG
LGANLFRETAASGASYSAQSTEQGAGADYSRACWKHRTVNVVEELVTMIETQRAY